MKGLLSSLTVFVVTGTAGGLYGPESGSRTYEQQNDYVLWFVQGVDTVGQPISSRISETLTFQEEAGALIVQVAMEGEGFSDSSAYTVDPTGRVLAVDGTLVSEIATPRVDLLPRIPFTLAELAPGTTWQDEVARSGEEPWGTTSYAANRSYTVVGSQEAFGTDALLLLAEGEIRLRQGGWQDPAETVSWGQEVAGPVIDSVWIDAATGQLVAGTTHMDLAGTAVFQGGGQSMSLPSGLKSSVRRVPPS